MKITDIRATTVTVPLEAPLRYEGGSVAVPEGAGLGVRLDRDKLAEYAEAYKRLGGYPYDQDPLRPGWAPTIPNNRWADPADSRAPTGIGF